MSTHKAYQLDSYGKLDSQATNITLGDVPVPVPQSGTSQVLVKISLTGVNPVDWKYSTGMFEKFRPLELPTILGIDFVGEVVRLAEDASSGKLRPGDRVIGKSATRGAFAEHIVMDSELLAKLPDNLNDEAAATLPLPASTAWGSVHATDDIKEGSKVLIHGASGNTGAFAVQFAKAAGAFVIAGGSEKNREYVLGLGADEYIDYHTQRFEDYAQDVDVVMNFTMSPGGNTVARSWQVLKSGGVFVSVVDAFIAKEAPEGRRGIFVQAPPDTAQLEKFAVWLAEGSINGKVGRIYPRSDLLKALLDSRAGETTGRLLLDFRQDE